MRPNVVTGLLKIKSGILMLWLGTVVDREDVGAEEGGSRVGLGVEHEGSEI